MGIKGIYSFNMVIMVILIWMGECQCGNAGAVSVPSQYQNYTTAQPITFAQEQQLVNIYNSLATIQGYQVSLSTTFNIYTNNQAKCDKTILTLSTYNSNNDLWLCFDQYNLLECNAQWQLVIKCGTFVQFHKPFNPNTLIQIDLAKTAWLTDPAGFQVTNAVIKSLCAGLYHIWFVYYSRAGKYIRAVKTVFIAYPNCPC